MASSSLKAKKVTALLDIDSFECQVWQRMYPSNNLWGRPCIVIDRTGRITSATYEAKALGISRQVRIGDARKLARQARADLQVFEKPNDREKPDCKETRYASWEIVDALKEYCEASSHNITIELSSCDEFYLELEFTDQTRFDSNLLVESQTYLESLGGKFHGNELKNRIEYEYKSGGTQLDENLEIEKLLVHGALIMQEVRNHVFKKTKFVASVGVAPNKLLAKIALTMNRPNGITVLPQNSLPRLGELIPLEKIPGLGGKFGAQLKEIFELSTINDLTKLELDNLEELFGKEKALEVFLKCRGIDDDPVKEKYFYEELNCGKNFVGQIKSDETLYYHLHCLVEEILERLEEERTRHVRAPTYMKVAVIYHYKNQNNEDKAGSTWNCTIHRAQQQSPKDLCEFVCFKMFHEIRDYSETNITRICLSAKGFKSLESRQ